MALVCRSPMAAGMPLGNGFDALTDEMTNTPGDRHVLAAAVRCHADLIVTYNRRHIRNIRNVSNLSPPG